MSAGHQRIELDLAIGRQLGRRPRPMHISAMHASLYTLSKSDDSWQKGVEVELDLAVSGQAAGYSRMNTSTVHRSSNVCSSIRGRTWDRASKSSSISPSAGRLVDSRMICSTPSRSAPSSVPSVPASCNPQRAPVTGSRALKGRASLVVEHNPDASFTKLVVCTTARLAAVIPAEWLTPPCLTDGHIQQLIVRRSPNSHDKCSGACLQPPQASPVCSGAAMASVTTCRSWQKVTLPAASARATCRRGRRLPSLRRLRFAPAAAQGP